MKQVPASVSFPKLEESVLADWAKNDTFQKSLDKNRNKEPYIFYDGPPFATGLPHYGHILTSYIKDIVPRYFTMKGRFVDRTWGWDCHGLPVEFEIEKNLNVSGKYAIEQLGVGTFNKACSDIVFRYADEWERIINRLGRWVDFKRQYRTMDLPYMESVMWLFSEFYNKGLIYEDKKVIAYCTRCQTPLSNFETGMDDAFRSRDDLTATVFFKLSGQENTGILAWTTTPWTLPSNVALAVNPELEYSLITMQDGQKGWIATARIESYAQLKDVVVERTVSGSELVGLSYEPMFPYFANTPNAFKVLGAAFVDTSAGTGIVHIAPAFGEDDYQLCKANGITGPDPLSADGIFSDKVTDFAGQTIFDANKPILDHLKKAGVLFERQSYRHNYPHCWRCDTPLIYRAISSWFMKVTDIKDQLVADNQKIKWVPEHIKDGRFGQWLQGARDWSLSRNRFWGSPVPVWKCAACEKLAVPNSLKELGEWCGREVEDLHRPSIDEVSWKCPCSAKGEFKRVAEVLDCWFESGAMPFAQFHYPFENQELFKKSFPADFVVEYISQTRGWFYTMVVESSGFMKQPPFTAALCHGVILAEDGRKMSKRLKNYPDPLEIVNENGSDALRIYLCSSTVVKGQDIRFVGKSVREAVRQYLLPLWNSLHFYTAYASLIAGYEPKEIITSTHSVDRHILSALETLRCSVEVAAEKYDLPECYDLLREFIDTLSSWYIRNNRGRFWVPALDEDSESALNTLYTVLLTLSKIAAPFIPFTAEAVFQTLQEGSVHLADWPEAYPQRSDKLLELDVSKIRRIIQGVRKLREKNTINLRQPLKVALISGVEEEVLKRYNDLLVTQTNVKNITFRATAAEFSTPQVTLNFKALGPVLKDKLPAVQGAIKTGKYSLTEAGKLSVEGFEFDPEFYSYHWIPKTTGEEVLADKEIVISLSLEIDENLRLEGLARDLNRMIQDERKRLKLPYDKRITLSATFGGDWQKAFDAHKVWIQEQALITSVVPLAGVADVESTDELGELKLSIA